MGTALIGGAVLGGAAQLGGAALGANAQTQAANQAAQTQLQMFGVTQKNLEPFQQFGASQLGNYSNLLNPGTAANQLTNLPGYQFSLQQGMRGVSNSSAARGLGASGAGLAGAANYTTGLAGNTYQQMLNNYQTAASLGSNAAAGVGSAATATGQGVAQTQASLGNALASAYTGGGNAIANSAQTGLLGLGYNNLYGSGATGSGATGGVG